MFSLMTTPSYFAPVSVSLPGEPRPHSFEVKFLRLGQEDIQTTFQRASEGELDDAAFCREVVIGWRGVQEEDGTPAEFNATALDDLLSIYPVAAAIVKSYTESLSGAKLKN